ncbi:roadblock/LC7 domain-containing protein [Streptomyces sp. NPDC055025]
MLAGSAGAQESSIGNDEFRRAADSLRGRCPGIETTVVLSVDGLAVAGSNATRESVEGASALINSVDGAAMTALSLGEGTRPRRPDHVIVASRPYSLATMAVGERLKLGAYFRPDADLATVMHEMAVTRENLAGAESAQRFGAFAVRRPAGRKETAGRSGPLANDPAFRNRAHQLSERCPEIHTVLFLSGDGLPVAWTDDLDGAHAERAAARISPLYTSASTALSAHDPDTALPDHIIVSSEPSNLVVMAVGERLRMAAYYPSDATFSSVLREMVRMRQLTLDVAPRSEGTPERPGGTR